MTDIAEQHICLVGLSGSGKSTVGPILAGRLRLGACIDLDMVIEQRLGSSVSEIFAEKGEVAFRQCESEALQEALAGPVAVIATGGGVVLDQTNRILLSRQATVVWLRCSVTDLADRLTDADGSRPLLAGDLEFALHRLAEERNALYSSVSDFVIDVDGLDPQAVSEEVIQALS